MTELLRCSVLQILPVAEALLVIERPEVSMCICYRVKARAN